MDSTILLILTGVAAVALFGWGIANHRPWAQAIRRRVLGLFDSRQHAGLVTDTQRRLRAALQGAVETTLGGVAVGPSAAVISVSSGDRASLAAVRDRMRVEEVEEMRAQGIEVPRDFRLRVDDDPRVPQGRPRIAVYLRGQALPPEPSQRRSGLDRLEDGVSTRSSTASRYSRDTAALVPTADGADVVPTQSDPVDETLQVVDPAGRRWPAPSGREMLVIGRSTHADVRINLPQVSRRHAELRLVDGRWVAQAVPGAVNGCKVDGADALPGHPRPLHEGSTLQLAGGVTLTVTFQVRGRSVA